MSTDSNGGGALLAMSDDAFTYLLLLIGAGAYALFGAGVHGRSDRQGGARCLVAAASISGGNSTAAAASVTAAGSCERSASWHRPGKNYDVARKMRALEAAGT